MTRVAMEESSPERNRPGVDVSSLLKIARARRGPYFYVVDEQLAVLVSRVNPGTDSKVGVLPRGVAAAATQILHQGFPEDEDSAVAVAGRGLVLRMVRLEGGTRARFALFLEPFEQRDLLRVASARYGFTSRERDVLNLMLRGESTSSISKRLHIAEATVQHHVKNIGSKVGVSKRVEIVAAIIGALR